MSWWDTSSISSLASQALKNAQKKIDKVLDIEADEKSGKSRRKKAPPPEQGSDSSTAKHDSNDEKGSGHDFWSGWMGKSDEEKKEESTDSPPHVSSWHLPWASPSQDSQTVATDASSSHTVASDRTSPASARLSLLGSRRSETARESSSLQSAPQKESETPEDRKPQCEQAEDVGSPVAESTSLSEEMEPDFPPASDLQNVPETAESNLKEPLSEDNRTASLVNTENISQENDKDKPEEALINNPVESGGGTFETSASDQSDKPVEVQDRLDPDSSVLVAEESKTSNLLSPYLPEDEDLKPSKSGWQDADSDLVLDVEDDNDNVQLNSCNQSGSTPPQEDIEWSQPEPCPEIHSSEESREPVKEIQDTSAEDSLEIVKVDDPDQDDLSEQHNKVEDICAAAVEDSSLYKDDSQVSNEELSNPVASVILEEKTVQESPAVNTETSVPPMEVAETLLIPEDSGDIHALTKPDSGQELKSVSSDASLIEDLERRSVEDVETATQQSQSLSQEYVNVSSVYNNSQVISLESSALGSDDCLHSSSEFDLGAVSGSSVNDLDPGHDLAGSTGSSDASRLDSSADTVVVGRTRQDSESAEGGYSLFGNDDATAPQVPRETGEDAADVNPDPLSPNTSYVKSLIQDAMDDMSNKTEDSGSDNHSNCEAKSESSKVDSEMEKSVYSGHESSDEIETTTSSDIEILSAPHSNGEAGASSAGSKFHTPFDFTPLQQRGQHRGEPDSHSSSSSQSKAGDGERLSPERGDGSAWRDDEFPHHELAAVKEEGPDSPYHPERLLKLAQSVVQQELRGGQKLAEMAEVLQARETKLIQLSKDNHSLAEDASILRCQLKKAEEARDAEAADLDALTQEFTVRIGEAEKKMQTVLKEKDRLKQQLTAAESELERRSADADVEAMLEEKRQQVEELLQEGEKLSKQQLQSSNIIKKLRAKEKENDTTITSQKKKLEDQSTELDHLKLVLNSKEEMEKKQTEAIGQLNNAVQKQEKELAKLRSDLEDAQEKSRGLQVALDNSYKEIAELHKSNATQDSKAQEAALSAETHVREELRAAMEREQMRFKQEREAFIMQADDLRLDMARLEKEHSRREDLLRQEVAHLQTRLQEDEARSQELTQSVSSATRPLLRQIENLQATYGAQANAWERVEKNLTDRLAEAQTSLAVAQEKERTSSQQFMELSAKMAALELANSSLRQEKATLAAKIEGDKSRLEELQDTRNSVVAQLETSKRNMAEELSQLKVEKMHLESQLSIEHTRVETEKKKSLALEEQLRLAERPRSRGTPSPSPSMSVSRQESVVGSIHEGYPGNMMNWSFHQDESESGSTVGVSRTSVYDSLRQSGAAIAVENMSSQLKLREGEITQLQSEISRLERTRESMARELVNLSNQNEELQEVKKQHEQLQQEFKELNQRYSAILQMYGEKEEQVQELRLDLQDVKEMYKTQIDALMAK